jgi:hypothetical protein
MMKRILATILFAAFAYAASDTLTISITVNNNDVDWANLQSPGSGTANVGESFDVYARVYEADSTNGAGQGGGIYAWIGYSESNATTEADFASGWTWLPATYHGDAYNDLNDLNNDEYKANLLSSINAPGTYYYVSRFSRDNATYKYGGYHEDAGGFWDGVTNVSGVLTVNMPITVTPIADQTLTEDVRDTLLLSATYSNSSPATGTWSVVGGHADSVQAVISGDTLFLNPAADYFGTNDIRFIVTITDAENVTGSDTFYVSEVIGVPDAPVIAAVEAQTLQEGELLTLNLTATDADGDALTWTSQNLPAGANFQDNSNGTAQFTWRPSYTQAGSYNPIFTVSDGSSKAAIRGTFSVPNNRRGGIR